MEEVVWCYGVAVWFETGFTERFCRENPVILSTSPYEPTTHWSQTLLTFREPVAMAASSSTRDDSVAAPVGTRDCPAARIRARISIVKASKHRSIDLSLEITCIGGSDDGRKRILPAQFFSLD
ncbi:hypothetical protein M569_16413 [Genlisea aurea]|uniref:Protein arginine N-methyltransferase domain-containing protein n=1 Tax=Genlisea aurea TaxID=192259 RepID=S8C1X2_9LAMI|nr:hypothetical protein M569_16413 [Genlisea aurea]